jgi:uncharacterized membrane protein
MTNSSNLTPIIGPLIRLMRSRKFLVALMTVTIDVLVAFVPELEPVQAELIKIFTVIGLGLIASIAYEDGHNKQPIAVDILQ